MSITDKEKLKLAKKLKIEVKEDTSEDDLDARIKDAEDKIESEKEQKKIEEDNALKAAEEAKKTKIVLKDTDGQDVDQKDYFYPELKFGKVVKTDTASIFFNKVCGLPVERHDLIEIFNNAFRKDKKFLFYKQFDKEVYLIIVPLKYATTVSNSNESAPGDFQKHALSFIGEGSVNTDSLKMKLARIAAHASISKEALA